MTQTSLSFPQTDAEHLAEMELKQKIALKWLFDTGQERQKRDREIDHNSALSSGSVKKVG